MVDPLADEFYSSSPYNYVDGNPITRIDPDGMAWFTKYKDENGKVLLDTKDGSNDVITVPNSMKAEFLESVAYTPADMYNGAGGWNSTWKAKILGDEKFEYLENNHFSSQWARQAAIDYFQNPTASNFGKFSLAESLSQWSRPEMVIGALSIAVAGLPRNAIRTSGGRLENSATRSQIAEIATELESRGYTITGGGGRLPEEYLKPIGGGRKGGSYVDLTATHPDYGTVRINTVDVYKNGSPTVRELNNATRIRQQIGVGNHLLLIPKR